MRSKWTAGNESMAKSYISWCEKSGYGMLAEQFRIMFRFIRAQRAEIRRCHSILSNLYGEHSPDWKYSKLINGPLTNCRFCKLPKGTR